MNTPRIPKRVLVTGASGALGSAVIARLSKEAGMEILAIDRKDVDLGQSRSVQTWVEALRAEGRLPDAWVHCAGGFRYAEISQTTDADWEFLIQANLTSAFYLARALMPGFIEQGFGRVVFISSRSTQSPGAGTGAYVASKAALNALAQTLAIEAGDRDITVNALLPTVIDTPANRKQMPQADASKWVPLEDLAHMAATLLLPVGKSVRGALIPVSGRL